MKQKKKKTVKKPIAQPNGGDTHSKEYKACMAAHGGESGYCDEGGGWHPLV